MANALVFLSDLQRGRSSSTLQVRLLRFWDPRNVGRGGDLMGVDMLLLDSQVLGGEKYEERRQPYRCRPSPPRCKSVSGDSHLSHRPVHDCNSISGECFFIYRSNDSSKHQLRK